jgi:hypothetical protein
MDRAKRHPKIFNIQFTGPVDMGSANSYTAVTDELGGAESYCGIAEKIGG